MAAAEPLCASARGCPPPPPARLSTAFLILCHLPRCSPSLFWPELIGLDPVLSIPHLHSWTSQQPLTALTALLHHPLLPMGLALLFGSGSWPINGSPILLLPPQHPTLPYNPVSELIYLGLAASSCHPHWSPVSTRWPRGAQQRLLWAALSLH